MIASVNYILITYALSNMSLLLQSSVLFILFFASEVWVTGIYWQAIARKCKYKALSVLAVTVCFAAQIGMVYLIGRAVGQIVPFRQ